MGALSEDAIVEIVARLPLKYAIQCLVLNKTLFRLISLRKNALASSSCPDINKSSIFYHYRRPYVSNILQILGPAGRCDKSITLPYKNEGHSEGPVILDSCNGILLLKDDNNGDVPCVFNPITGGIMFVRSTRFKLHGAIKLAVDLQDSRFVFKLVTVDCTPPLWEVTIFARLSGRPSWLVTSLEFEGGCGCCSSKSVYAHGCMYWPLCKKPNEIMVLDLAKEEIRTISFPFSESPAPLLFVRSDGSLQSVCELQDQIVIRRYDEVKDEWVLKHEISNIVPRSRVRFFDGQRLLITQKEGVITRGVIHDVLNDKWDNIGTGGDVFSTYNGPRTIFWFVPSLAKVSDEYLDNLVAKSEDPGYFSSFAGLQHIITQESNAWNKLQEIKAANVVYVVDGLHSWEKSNKDEFAANNDVEEVHRARFVCKKGSKQDEKRQFDESLTLVI